MSAYSFSVTHAATTPVPLDFVCQKGTSRKSHMRPPGADSVTNRIQHAASGAASQAWAASAAGLPAPKTLRCARHIPISLIVITFSTVADNAPFEEGSPGQIDEEEHQQNAGCHRLSEEIALKIVSQRAAYVITDLNRDKLLMRHAPDTIPRISRNKCRL